MSISQWEIPHEVHQLKIQSLPDLNQIVPTSEGATLINDILSNQKQNKNKFNLEKNYGESLKISSLIKLLKLNDFDRFMIKNSGNTTKHLHSARNDTLVLLCLLIKLYQIVNTQIPQSFDSFLINFYECKKKKNIKSPDKSVPPNHQKYIDNLEENLVSFLKMAKKDREPICKIIFGSKLSNVTNKKLESEIRNRLKMMYGKNDLKYHKTLETYYTKYINKTSNSSTTNQPIN
ncbi:hypothetical protein ACTFIZ_008733 [Dictyostelium cf. discoideum]